MIIKYTITVLPAHEDDNPFDLEFYFKSKTIPLQEQMLAWAIKEYSKDSSQYKLCVVKAFENMINWNIVKNYGSGLAYKWEYKLPNGKTYTGKSEVIKPIKL